MKKKTRKILLTVSLHTSLKVLVVDIFWYKESLLKYFMVDFLVSSYISDLINLLILKPVPSPSSPSSPHPPPLTHLLSPLSLLSLLSLSHIHLQEHLILLANPIRLFWRSKTVRYPCIIWAPMMVNWASDDNPNPTSPAEEERRGEERRGGERGGEEERKRGKKGEKKLVRDGGREMERGVMCLLSLQKYWFWRYRLGGRANETFELFSPCIMNLKEREEEKNTINNLSWHPSFSSFSSLISPSLLLLLLFLSSLLTLTWGTSPVAPSRYRNSIRQTKSRFDSSRPRIRLRVNL